MRVLVIGSRGQLGSKVVELLTGEGSDHEVRGEDLPELDITQGPAVHAVVGELKPRWIVNCAAYTDVEQAEDEPEAAYQLNAVALKTLADAAALHGSRLLHISTDYVFSGLTAEGERVPHGEEAPPGPLNVYGASKLAGELVLEAHEVTAVVLRTSWLYGGPGKNFLHTMLHAGRKALETGEPLRVVADQLGTPTDAWSLARQIVHLLPLEVAGLFHASSHGETSWFNFARTIFELSGLDAPLEPVCTAEYPTRARRPAYSVLRNGRLESLGLDVLPDWKEGLEQVLGRLEAPAC